VEEFGRPLVTLENAAINKMKTGTLKEHIREDKKQQALKDPSYLVLDRFSTFRFLPLVTTCIVELII
jgi:hypothetical protein